VHGYPCTRGRAEHDDARTTQPTERTTVETTDLNTTAEATELNRHCEQVKRALRTDPDFISVTDIEDDRPHQRVLGVETENGAEFFIVIQLP